MAIAPLQPHSSWYRRFWYAKRSPLDTLVDRVLIFGILVLIILVGTTRLMQHDDKRQPVYQPGFTEVVAL